MELNNLPRISAPLPWQRPEWDQLQQQLAAGQLPHALLLAGRQYTGKSQLALALSRLLLCPDADRSGNCGHCHACELSATGGHGDFRWVQPEEKSRVIKIEQIREVVRFTNKTAGYGLRKVIVLAPADTMNVNAFNALLKALEEPARDTYLILVCHRMYGVPATIRSRCQIIRLTTPHKEVCLDWVDQTTGNREHSEELLSLADGLPVLAQQLYNGGSADAFLGRQLGLQGLLAGQISVPETSAMCSELEITAFLEQLARELQRLLGSLSLERLRSIEGRAVFVLLHEVGRLQQEVSAGVNPNKQLLVEAVLSKCRSALGAGLLGDTISEQRGGALV